MIVPNTGRIAIALIAATIVTVAYAFVGTGLAFTPGVNTAYAQEFGVELDDEIEEKIQSAIRIPAIGGSGGENVINSGARAQVPFVDFGVIFQDNE